MKAAENPDGIVDGEEFNETMSLGYNDRNLLNDGGGDQITNDADVIEGNGGNDTIDGSVGDDLIKGGIGDDLLDGDADKDTLTGGSGNDTIIGDSESIILTETFSWAEIDGGTIAANDNVDTGSITVGDVTIGYDFSDTGSIFSPEPLFVGGLEDSDRPINANSSIGYENSGTGIITFSQPVENLQFRINDFERGLEEVTIRAFDAAGNPITITSVGGSGIAGSDTDGVAGNDTFVGTASSTNDLNPVGSVLISISGPVFRIEIDFTDVSGGSAALSDLVFDVDPTLVGVGDDDVLAGGIGNDVIESRDGNDLLDGGADNDDLDGGIGNDTMLGGTGQDTLEGGTGDDLMIGGTGNGIFFETAGDGPDTITDFNVGNTGPINDLNQTNNDFVDLAGFYNSGTLADVNNLIADPSNEFASELEMLRADAADGTLDGAIGDIDLTLRNAGTAVTGSDLTFDNTNVECFTPGTMITTLDGLRPVEELEVGDLILTMDSGYQPLRWVGNCTLEANVLEAAERLRPVRIKAGAFGPQTPTADLVVSPQHRMLLRSKIAHRMFGEHEVLLSARSMIDLDGVAVDADCASVTYIHLMFNQHEIIFANGTPAESLYLGVEAIKSLREESLQEITAIFPNIQSPDFQQGLARLTPDKGRQIKKLLERHQTNAKAFLELNV